jgi:hypothetical protein
MIILMNIMKRGALSSLGIQQGPIEGVSENFLYVIMLKIRPEGKSQIGKMGKRE